MCVGVCVCRRVCVQECVHVYACRSVCMCARRSVCMQEYVQECVCILLQVYLCSYIFQSHLVDWFKLSNPFIIVSWKLLH